MMDDKLTHRRCSVCNEFISKLETERWDFILFAHYNREHPDIIELATFIANTVTR